MLFTPLESRDTYLFIYVLLVSGMVYPRETGVCFFFLQTRKSVRQLAQPVECVFRLSRKQDPLFFFFLIPQESLCPRDTCKHAVYGVCSISNCHFQAGILILCRKMSVLDSRLILYVLVQCDYML